MLSKIMKHHLYQMLCTILLALILIGLPLTSFPPLIKITSSLVAPFSAIPLALMMLIWLIPYVAKKGVFPKETLPFLYFVLFAIAITAGAFFLDGFYIRNKNFFDQGFRALLTLGVGFSFYITLSAYVQNRSVVKQFMLFLYIGGMLTIILAAVEIILLRNFGSTANFPEWITNFRASLVFQKSGLQYTDRLSGFAYEPSWFVLVFDLVLFPLWLSAVFQRKSLFNVRVWRFLVEDALLVLGLIAFVFSFPRIGLLALVVMLAYLGLLGVNRLYRFLLSVFLKQKKFKIKKPKLTKVILAILLIIFVLTVVIGGVLLFVKVASQTDPRYQLMLDQLAAANLDELSITETGIIILARRLAFYERTIYWFGGWNIFNDYPFGVGLGNAGFYFAERMNSLGYESVEIRNLLYQTDIIINTKSLWFRLIAETGLIGFSLFMTWIYLLWRSSAFIQKSRDPIMKIVGMAGKFFILAYLVEGFSVDSFALPYQWIIAALITGSRLIVHKELSARGKTETASAG
jgi:hypothetical protein